LTLIICMDKMRCTSNLRKRMDIDARERQLRG
jgi:hypothetical protein